MFDPALKSEITRTVKEAYQIMAQMRSVASASAAAEEQSRKAIRESRKLLLTCAGGDTNY